MSLRDFFNSHKPKSTRGIFADVLNQVQPGEEGIALDLCCGMGQLTELLSEQGYRAFGVDLADYFIGAEGAAADGYTVADVNHLPFKTACASLVCSVDSLQYFADPGAVIHEIGRLLKPGGQLILSTQNNSNPAGGKKWLIKKLTGRDWSPWLLHPVENFVTYPWLIRTLEAEGFEVEVVRGKQFLTAWVSLLPGWLRHWSPWREKPWRSIASIAGRIQFPDAIETSLLARYAMIVLISARKR